MAADQGFEVPEGANGFVIKAKAKGYVFAGMLFYFDLENKLITKSEAIVANAATTMAQFDISRTAKQLEDILLGIRISGDPYDNIFSTMFSSMLNKDSVSNICRLVYSNDTEQIAHVIRTAAEKTAQHSVTVTAAIEWTATVQGRKKTKKSEGDDETSGTLSGVKIVPITSPVKGKPVTELAVGEQIYIKFEDDEMSNPQVQNYMAGLPELEEGETYKIIATVVQTKPHEVKGMKMVEMLVQINPGFLGRSLVTQALKVKNYLPPEYQYAADGGDGSVPQAGCLTMAAAAALVVISVGWLL